MCTFLDPQLNETIFLLGGAKQAKRNTFTWYIYLFIICNYFFLLWGVGGEGVVLSLHLGLSHITAGMFQVSGSLF